MTIEIERQRVAAMNARSQVGVRARGIRNERDRWLLEATAMGEVLIGPPRLPSLPSSFNATCSAAELARLRALLGEVQAFAAGLEGLGSVEASALYNGDLVAVLLRDELIDWSLAHARARLSRPSPKDNGDPYRKFLRLNLEICAWLEELCLLPGVSVALCDVPDRIATELWDATVAPELRIQPDGRGLWLDYGRLDPAFHSAIRETLLLYCWNDSDALDRARTRFPERVAGDPAELRRRRIALAEDLQEARALTIADHDVLAAARAQGAGWLTFEWSLQHTVAHLISGPDHGDLARQVEMGLFGGPLRVLLDGRIAGAVRWWEPADDPGWEVALLEPLHARVVEDWLARVPSTAPVSEPESPAAAVALVADACRHIAEPVDGHRIPAVRMEVLLRLLERSFGCEVSVGKGSEVTVYRPGGRKFTLGHHTRNRHVPAHLVRALLKAVGIAVTEWWRTLNR